MDLLNFKMLVSQNSLVLLTSYLGDELTSAKLFLVLLLSEIVYFDNGVLKNYSLFVMESIYLAPIFPRIVERVF